MAWFILVLVAGTGVTAAEAAALHDLTGHWAEAEVAEAMQAGLVDGFPDGTYRPDERVTRAQFIKLMAKVQALPPQPGTAGFGDLQGHWLADQGVIQAAVAAHLVEPSDYGDPPVLSPDQPITRQEAAVLATRAMNRLGAALTLHGAPLPYTDPVPDWVTGYVATVTSTGAMKGYGGGAFAPGEAVTRAQAAAIALRVLKASRAGEVPVWEANGWKVSTLPYDAYQVAAALDGTLYLLKMNGEVWRMEPGGTPALFYSGLAMQNPVTMAAGPGGLFIAQSNGVLRITGPGQAELWVGSLAWDSQQSGYRNGTGAEARFQGIGGLCTDTAGNLYITENGNDYGRVRKVDAQGHVSTLAGLTPRQATILQYGMLYGHGTNLNEGGDGPGYLVTLRHPTACAVDGAGRLFVVDADATVRQIAPDGTVSWYAGGTNSLADGGREEAGFEWIRSLVADSWGNLWLVEGRNERIRRITPDGHVYTVAGGGGRPILTHGMHEDVKWPAWVPEGKQADGPGPDARFDAPTTLALAGGKLYVTDSNGNLRLIAGRAAWYRAAGSVVLQPQMDDMAFWVFGGGRFRPEEVRLPVALYEPVEAVGLKVDGQWASEAHHPLYTLRWQATPGRHRLVPMVRRPDTTWAEGDPRDVEVAADGASTQRNILLLPRERSWVKGQVELRAISDWSEAEIKVDGEVIARGTGLITATWDTTRVSDGIHRVSLATGGHEPGFKEVLVFNGALPVQEPEDAGWTLYLGEKRYNYQGTLLPQTRDSVPMLPLRETAAAAGYRVSWDPDARLVTLTNSDRTATLNVDTGATDGTVLPLASIKAIQAGDDFLVDWFFFTALTGMGGPFDESDRIVILRP